MFNAQINFTNGRNELKYFFNKIPQKTIHLYFNKSNNKYDTINIYDYPTQQNILINIINYANNIMINKLNKKFFNNNFKIWNICVVNDILFNLPCTINNVIFIPFNIIVNNNHLLITLIHEKIHICQRYNVEWNKLKINNWLQIPQSFSYNYLKSLTNDNIIYNPDIMDVNNYVYLKNNKKYYGILIYKNFNVQILWFEYNNNILIPLNNNNIHKYEHPYEQIAYELSEKLF